MHNTLVSTGIAFAGISAAIFLASRLHFPSIPFLIAAGILLGPGVSGVVTDLPLIKAFANFGVTLILFFLGLEFAVRDLLSNARRKILNGLLDLAINFSLGFAIGYFLLGLGYVGALFVAGIVYVSSSGMIARLIFELQRSTRAETGLILSILVFEDLAIAAYLAVMPAISGTSKHTTTTALLIAATALTLAIAWISASRHLSRLAEKLFGYISSDELFLVTLFAGVLLFSGAAETLNISSAIGAFLLGLIFAETSHIERIEQRLRPIHDIFSVVFFFYFGLTMQFQNIGMILAATALATVLSILGKTATGYLAGKFAGLSFPAALTAGLTLIPRGEFSIVLAALATAAGLGDIIGPFTALYILLLAVAGPLLTRESFRIAEALRHLRPGKSPSN